MTTGRPPEPDRPADPPDETAASRPATETPHAGGGTLRWADEPAPERVPPARRAARIGATLLIFAIALFAALVIWTYYVTSPWTRDGSVRVQVANVAPLVAGQIAELHIVDNQYVRKGYVLYVIDPFDYRVKLAGAKATVKQEAADYQVKRLQAQRYLTLGSDATTAQQQQQAVATADMAQASFEQAQPQQEQAEINLQRTQVRSPVNGFVTNLLMRVGDYADTGTSNVSVIDTDSYWIDGYFEETKIGRICVGDPAEAQLMGFDRPIVGEIETVTRGISASNAAPSTQGLPSVNAVYTWVRLAQRVPVRIRIKEVPAGAPLVSGLTATVTVRTPGDDPSGRGIVSGLFANVRDVFVRTPPRPDCIPATAGATGPVSRLPEPQPSAPLSPAQIEPGVAPGMDSKPRSR